MPVKQADAMGVRTRHRGEDVYFGDVLGGDERLALEPRILLDAAGGETAEHALDDADAVGQAAVDALNAGNEKPVDPLVAALQEEEELAQSASESSGNDDSEVAAVFDEDTRTEIIFVDEAVEDIDSLVDGFGPNAEVHFISSASDGVVQIAALLEGRSDISAIHIFSHGDAGSLTLGSATLTESSMRNGHADALIDIGAALGTNADILIYGCDFGRGIGGQTAVATLAALTGADVAASEDLTGAEHLGGDWDLEVESGVVETEAIAVATYGGVLAPFEISPSGAPSISGGSGLGATALWTNSGTVGGVPIDIRATVVETISGTPNVGFATTGDDLRVIMYNAAEVRIRWEVFQAGTGQTVTTFGSPDFLIQDLDGSGAPETIETVAAGLAGLNSVTTETPSNLVVTLSGDTIRTTGTADQSAADTTAWVRYAWDNVDSWELVYRAYSGGRFYDHDGDGDLTFVNPNVFQVPGIFLDLDDNDSTAQDNDYAATFTEGDAPVAIADADLTLYDPEEEIATLTVELTDGQIGDLLQSTGTLPGGITVISAPAGALTAAGMQTLTFSGLPTTTNADWQAALAGVRFEPSTGTPTNPAPGDRHITVQATDIAARTSPLATATIAVVPLHEAPSLNLDPNNDSGTPGDPGDDGPNNGGFQTSYIENQLSPAPVVDGDFTLTDSDEDILEIVVTLTNGQIGDTFNFPSNLPGNVSASVVPIATLTAPGPMTITLSGDASTTNADWNTILSSIGFSPSTSDVHNPDPTDRVITIAASDSQNQSTGALTTIVEVVPENDLPTLDLDDFNTSGFNAGNYGGAYDENDPGVAISDGVVITDLDDGNLESLTVSLTNGQVGDLLNIGALPAGISLIGPAPTALTAPGVMTVQLTGSASLADYQTAIAAITYSSTSENPDGTDREIEVFVNDGENDSPTRTAFIEVTAINDAPIPTDPANPGTVATVMPQQSGNDAVALASFDATLHFFDIEGDTLAYSLDVATTPAWLSIDPVSGIVTGTPPGDASQNTNQLGNPDGTYTITVIATDPGGLTASQEIEYQITNPAPVAMDDAIGHSESGGVLSSNVITAAMGGQDNDPDGDAISVSAVNNNIGNVGLAVAGSNGGLFTIGTNGDLSLDLNGEFEDLADGETRDTTVTYRISDADGGVSNDATVTVTVTGTNDAPKIQDPGNPGVEDGGFTPPALSSDDSETVTGQPQADLSQFFFDVDASDTLTFDVTGLPAGLTFNPATGEVTGQISASASQGGPNSDGVYQVTVEADDGIDQTPVTFTWSVSNPAPVANDDTLTTAEDAPLSGNLITNTSPDGADSDPDGDAISVTAAQTPGGTVLFVNPVGSPTPIATPLDSGAGLVTLYADGTFDLAPAQDYFGTETFTYTLTDADGGSDTAIASFNVTPVNDPPVLNLDPDNDSGTPADAGDDNADDGGLIQTFTEGDAPLDVVDTDGLVSDVDDNAVASLSISLSGLTDTDQDGSEKVTIGGEVFELEDGGLSVITVGGSDFLVAYAANPAGNSGSFAISAAPPATSMPIGDVNALLASITYQHTGEDPTDGARTLTFTATDGTGDPSQPVQSVVNVVHVNDPPSVVAPTDPGFPGALSSNDGETIAAVPLAPMFEDDDHTDAELTFNATGLPAGLTFNPATGAIEGTVDPAASQGGPNSDGIYVVTVSATDPEGGVVSTTFNWSTSNLPPVAQDDAAGAGEDDVAATTGNVITDAVTGDADMAPDSDSLTVTGANDGGGNPLTIGVPHTLPGGGTIMLDGNGDWSFDPGMAYNGLDVGEAEVETVTYTVSDGQGGTDTATLSITVSGANDAPVIVDPGNPGPDPENPIPADPATIVPVQNIDDGEDFSVTPLIDVAQFAVDPDGEVMTFSTTGTLPPGLTLNPDGTITGVVDNSASQGGPNSDGVYPFDVIVDDGTTTSTVSVTLDAANVAPVAEDDVAGAGEDDAAQTTGNVITDALTGDTDGAPDSDALEVASATDGGGNPITLGAGHTLPGGGTLVLNDDGSWSFNPGTSYNGLDDGETEVETVTYVVTDNEGGTDTATLTITVTGDNDGPVVVDPGNPGPDPENPIPADPNTIVPVQTVDDGSDFSVNPLINMDDYIVDPDDEMVSYSLIGALPPGLTLNPDGTITGVMDNSSSQGGPNSDGVYSVAVVASDGDVQTPISLTIAAQNTAPVAADDSATQDEDSPAVSGNVISDPVTGDIDGAPDSDVLEVISAQDGGANAVTLGAHHTLPGGGVITLNPDGSWDFDPGNSYNGLDDGETEVETVTYIVSDNEGGTDTATLTLTMTGSNDAPVIVDPGNPGPDLENPIPANPATVIPVQQIDDGADYSAVPLINVADYAIDPDDEALTYTTLGSLPPGLTLNPDGTVTGTVDNSASQGGPNNDGQYSVQVIVDDGTDTASVTLSFNASNVAPVASDDAQTLVEDDVAATSGNVITDPLTGDVDGAPDSDVLTISSATDDAGNSLFIGAVNMLPGGGLLTLNPDGSWDFDPGTAYNGLDDGETEIETVTYVVSDGEGGTDTATLTLTVTGTNDAPVIVDPGNPGPDPENPIPADPSNVVPVVTGVDSADHTGTPLVDLSPYVVDPDDEPVTFSVIGTLPPGLTLNPDGTVTGTISRSASQGGPNGDGRYDVTVVVGDGTADSRFDLSFDISNPAPIADPIPDVEGTAGLPFDLDLGPYLTDPDGDPLEFRVDGLPDSLTIDPVTGRVSGEIDPIAAIGGPGGDGTFTVTLTVTDGEGGEFVTTFTFKVLPQDAAPQGPNVPSDEPDDPPDPFKLADPEDPIVLDAVNGVSLLTGIGSADGDSGIIGTTVNNIDKQDQPHSLDGLVSIHSVNNLINVLGEDPLRGSQISDQLAVSEQQVEMRTLVYQDHVFLDLMFGQNPNVQDWTVRILGSQIVPDWVTALSGDVVLIERIANLDNVDLEVVVRMKDGRLVGIPINVVMESGLITLAGQPGEPQVTGGIVRGSATPLSDTLNELLDASRTDAAKLYPS